MPKKEKLVIIQAVIVTNVSKNLTTREMHERLKKSTHPKSGPNTDREIMKSYKGPKKND